MYGSKVPSEGSGGIVGLSRSSTAPSRESGTASGVSKGGGPCIGGQKHCPRYSVMNTLVVRCNSGKGPSSLRMCFGIPRPEASSVLESLRTPRSVVIQGPSEAQRGHGMGSVLGSLTCFTCGGALAAWSRRGTRPGGVSRFPMGLGSPGGAIVAHFQLSWDVARKRATTNLVCVIAPPTESDATTLYLDVYPKFAHRVVVSFVLGPLAQIDAALSQNSITRRGLVSVGVAKMRSSQNVPRSSSAAGRGLWRSPRSTTRQSTGCWAR